MLQQLNLSIEESHNANDGNAKGCGEKHFVEHLFLLFSDPGLGHMARISSPRNKLDWRDNRPARTARVDPLRCSRSQRKRTSKPASKGPEGKSMAALWISAIYPLKRPEQAHAPPVSTTGITESQTDGMKSLLLLLVVAASIWAGVGLDRAGWKYRKQLWQFQGAATGLVAGYLLGRSRLI